MRKKIIFLFITIGLCAPLAFAARAYRSPRYALREVNTIVSCGQCESVRYRLKDIVIGAVFAGQAKSAHYGIFFRVCEQPAPDSEENRPNPPVVYPLSSPTNKPEQHLLGKKDPGTAIYINGYPAAARDDKTDWSAKVTLVKGANSLLITSRNQEGWESDAVLLNVTLDITAPRVQITSPPNNSTSTSSPITVYGNIDDAQAVVTVNGSGAKISGTTFTAEGITLATGENTISATAVDAAGNTSYAYITVILDNSGAPCPAPSIDPPQSPTNIVSQTITGGKSEDAAAVIVTSPTAQAGTVTYPNSLTWSCRITNLKEGENLLNVCAKNKQGNTSPTVTAAIVVDTIGPRVDPLARVLDANHFDITYNEAVREAQRGYNYTITPSLGAISAWARSETIYRLSTSDPAIAGTTYTITVGNVSDTVGNLIDEGNNTAAFTGPTNSNTKLSKKLLVKMEAEQDAEVQFGCAMAGNGDVNGDGYSDVVIGACGSVAYHGKAHLYFGGPAMDEITDIALTRENTPVFNDEFGRSAAFCGDINGDGYADVIVGAPQARNASSDTCGKAFVYFGGTAMDGKPDIVLAGPENGRRFGHCAASAGDLNGDGYHDLVVGAPFPDPYNIFTAGIGKVYIYFGGPAMDATADLILAGEGSKDEFGYCIASAGDINADGFSDLIIGAPVKDTVYIYLGSRTMDSTADFTITGIKTDKFGYSIASCGDINNDGFSDIIIGAPEADDKDKGQGIGKVYIYFGGNTLRSQPNLVFTGEGAFDNFGTSVACTGDVNNDGFIDVIIGAPRYNQVIYWEEDDTAYEGYVNTGKAYVYFGGPQIDTVCDISISRRVKGNLGCAVSSAGDTNNDGFDEFIIGVSSAFIHPDEWLDGEVFIYTLAPLAARLAPRAKVIDPKNVEIRYSEEVAGADKNQNYTISPALGTITVSDRGNNTYRLTTSSTQQAGQTYTITVQGITNLQGEGLNPYYNRASFTGYNPKSVPVVTAFKVFDLDKGDVKYTDSTEAGVYLTITDTDGRIAGWLLNESSQKPASSAFTLQTKPVSYTLSAGDGKKTVYAWVMDNDGNISILNTTSQWTITLDSAPPAVKIDSPAKDKLFSSAAITVSGSISDITPVQVTVHGIKATISGSRFTANNIVLQQGTNLITATAQDALGHTASDAVAVILDSTAPTQPLVTDDGDYTASLSELHASWSAQDLESGIAEYQYAIGTSPGKTDILTWTSAGKGTQSTRANLSLESGKTYYWTVMAVNGLGVKSAQGVSDGIEVNFAQAKTRITYPAPGQTVYGDTTVTAEAQSASGIAHIEFYLDEQLQYKDTAYPYQWRWDVSQTAAGAHTLKALGCDNNGNTSVDRIKVVIAEKDTSAPQLFPTATVIDANNVEVTYTRAVLNADKPANYTITPDLAVFSVTSMGNNTYRLATDTHISWTTYTIAVSNVTDLSGNMLDPNHNSAQFTGGQKGSLTTTAVFHGQKQYDRLGYSAASAGDVNADGYADIITGNGSPYGSGYKVFIYYGGEEVDTVADVSITGGNASSGFGLCTASAGDINNDGYSDVIIGASGARAAYIYFGGATMDSAADVTLKGPNSSSSYFGFSVAFAGDINNDGYSDVIVGDKGFKTAYIYLGGATMDSVADITLQETGDYFGCSVACAGDVNNDGYSDVIVGAEGKNTAYIYLGAAAMNSAADVTLQENAYYFGGAAACAGDVNNDGYSDVIVGAKWADSAYIYLGGISMDAGADVVLKEDREKFGQVVSSCGDINADGYSDAIVTGPGLVCVYFGSAAMDAAADITLEDEGSAAFGCCAASAGAVDGSGVNAFLVGAYLADTTEIMDAGAVYLFSEGISPPKLDPQAQAIDAYTVEIRYTQNVTGADTAANYAITPALGKITVSPAGNNKYRLTTAAAQTAGTHYVIVAKNIANTAGMPLAEGCNQAHLYGYNPQGDNTPPVIPQVTDGGRSTNSLTALSASWFSTDPESGVVEYQYAIGSKIEQGALITDTRNWTSCGQATGITSTGLTLSGGKTYYFAVKAKNGKGLWSEPGFSDGITVNTAPCANATLTLAGGNTYCEGNAVSVSVKVTQQAAKSLEYQFLVDGVIKRSWSNSPDFVWNTTAQDTGAHTIQAQVRGDSGNTVTTETRIFIFRKAVAPPVS